MGFGAAAEVVAEAGEVASDGLGVVVAASAGPRPQAANVTRTAAPARAASRALHFIYDLLH
jgi:hypothetical protein